MTKGILIAYVVWNIIVFFVYGYDKHQAKKEGQRVPEKTLLLLAFFFGGAGAYIGMQSFRHKTKHKSFQILVPIFLALNLVALYFIAGFNFIEWWIDR